MSENAVLTRLGFSSSDRVVVLHADDIGMCQSTVTAYQEIVARGIVSAASAMPPCGWFPAVAALCREDQRRDGGGRYDMGLHLTLTSEWRDYRWGPLSGADTLELTDEAGYFHALAADLHRTARSEVVHRELRAQLERAHQLGVDVTHLDSHMLALFHPELIDVYLQLSREFRVPNSVIRFSPDKLKELCPLARDAEALVERIFATEHEDIVVFDAWAEMPLHSAADPLDTAKRILAGLPAGLSMFVSHPAQDTPELRAIAPDWEARVADYRLYLDDAWADAIAASGVKVIGMRAIRDAIFG